MIKLNNKGFAVSTILYGILALTIIILMLVFGIMKSSKDMNQDLATSIEEDINNCTLSEVELEQCYFEGGNCDTSEYYNCIGKKEEDNLLYNVAEIGDFVNYDAGVWPLTVSIPDESESFVFGGYDAGKSRNITVNYNGLDGWRVLYKKDNYVYLIHAGISEYFYFFIDEVEQTIYNYEQIMTGSTSGSYNENYNYTFKNWNNDYLNSEYAEEVRLVTNDDLITWKSQTNMNYEDSDMIAINDTYLLSDTDTGISEVLTFNFDFKDITHDNKGLYGVRPVVKLKQGVKTSGSVSNTYGINEWILVK